MHDKIGPRRERGAIKDQEREASSAGGSFNFCGLSFLCVLAGASFIPYRDKKDVLLMTAHSDGGLPVEFMHVPDILDVVFLHPTIHILIKIIERGVTGAAYKVFHFYNNEFTSFLLRE